MRIWILKSWKNKRKLGPNLITQEKVLATVRRSERDNLLA
jgi:hypothetical protein